MWVDYTKYNPKNRQDGVVEHSANDIDYPPLRRLTMASFIMGVLISMGGFVYVKKWTWYCQALANLCFPSFGYDTGQVSGFLELPDFLERFGQRRSSGEYYFSNVRSGLIVGLVSRARRALDPEPNKDSSLSAHSSVHWWRPRLRTVLGASTPSRSGM